MSFSATTLKFEGPLDLMLHLIREKELDIFDLDIDVLLDQYLAYLHALEDLQLEVESEYLVELATLIEYKSKKLLPKDESQLEGEYEEDPKDVLIRRLLEYQQFKEVSSTLNEAYLQRQESLSKPLTYDANHFVSEEALKIEGNPNDLLKAMNKLMRRLQLSRPLETKLTQKEISIDDRILQIKARLLKLPETFDFETLIDDCTSVHEVIVTFLSVLDLAKNHTLYFTVDQNEQIWFKRGGQHA